MHAAALLSISFLTALSVAQCTRQAIKTTGNPTGIIYEAILAPKPDAPETSIKGSIRAEAPADGVGVKFTVHFENMPAEGGPFAYHLHDAPVPADGNCTQAMGHLSPFGRADKPPCDASAPQTCQVGDLSGKHGKVMANPFDAEYIDQFTSLKEDNQAFFGSRSFVLHLNDGARVACANFVKKEAPAPIKSESAPSGAECMI